MRCSAALPITVLGSRMRGGADLHSDAGWDHVAMPFLGPAERTREVLVRTPRAALPGHPGSGQGIDPAQALEAAKVRVVGAQVGIVFHSEGGQLRVGRE